MLPAYALLRQGFSDEGRTREDAVRDPGPAARGTCLNEPQWVTLTVAVMTGGSADREAFASRISGSLKITDDEARARIDELAAAQAAVGRVLTIVLGRANAELARA